jgi:hypothetical protein
MVRRLLFACGAVALAAAAVAAKPPDLPLDVNGPGGPQTCQPAEPPAPAVRCVTVEVQLTPAAPAPEPGVCEAQAVCRSMMACALLGAHPLLAMLPAEGGTCDCPGKAEKHEIVIGVPCLAPLGCVVRAIVKSAQQAEAPQPRPITCPYKAPAPRVCGLPVEGEMTPSVMDNLDKLIKAEDAYRRAEELRLRGLWAQARECYAEAAKLCPGSRYEALAEAGINATLAQGQTGAATAAAGPKKCGDSRGAKEKEIEERLSLPISMQYDSTPLRQVIEDIRTARGVNICLDQTALDEEGVDLDHPVSTNLEQVSLKSALSLVLYEVHLTYVVKDEVLMITTQKRARGKLVTHTYPVADLVGGSNADLLVAVLILQVAPQSWAQVGGPGTIDFFPATCGLVVNQTPDVQEQIADYLQCLRRRMGGGAKKLVEPEGKTGFCFTEPLPAPREAEKKCGNARGDKEKEIEERLQQPITVNFESTPLRQVIEDIRTARGINVYIDVRALEEAGIGLDAPVTIKLEQVALKTVLSLILKDHGLTYVIKDEVLQITTQAKARGKSKMAVYAVGDLVDDDDSIEDLIGVVTTTIDPASWVDNGGAGTIDYFALGKGLVVNQTPDVQEQVVELLAALRRVKHADKIAVRIQVRALMKACRRAMERGDHDKAADLAREAFALDPQAVEGDPLVYKMHLLTLKKQQPAATTGERLPERPQVGEWHSAPAVCPPAPRPDSTGRSGVEDGYPRLMCGPAQLEEMALRPELPPVDGGIAAVLDRMLPKAMPGLTLHVDEEQPPQTEATGGGAGVELTLPPAPHGLFIPELEQGVWRLALPGVSCAEAVIQLGHVRLCGQFELMGATYRVRYDQGDVEMSVTPMLPKD